MKRKLDFNEITLIGIGFVLGGMVSTEVEPTWSIVSGVFLVFSGLLIDTIYEVDGL